MLKVDPKDTETCVHLKEFLTHSSISEQQNPGLGITCDADWATVIFVREAAQLAIEQSKKAQGLENPLDMGVTLPDPEGRLAKFDPSDLADLLGVSRVKLDSAASVVTVQDLRAEPRCERSWRRDGTVKARSDGGMLSDRDAEALSVQ